MSRFTDIIGVSDKKVVYKGHTFKLPILDASMLETLADFEDKDAKKSAQATIKLITKVLKFNISDITEEEVNNCPLDLVEAIMKEYTNKA